MMLWWCLVTTVRGSFGLTLESVGGSLPANLYLEAIRLYNLLDSEASKVEYRIKSSSAAFDDIKGENSVDFVGSDALLADDDYDRYPDMQMLPSVAAAIAVVYNLPGVEKLVLPRTVVAKIYLGTIKYWNTTEIRAWNPNLALPNAMIRPYVRDGASGTTEIFTKALSSFDSDFSHRIGASQTPEWCEGQSDYCKNMTYYYGKGNAGMASSVVVEPYSIGYTVLSYAIAADVKMVDLVNRAGQIVSPSSVSTSFSMMELGGSFDDRLNADLVDASSPSAWPIAGYTYFVIRKRTHLGRGPACESRRAMLDFFSVFYSSPVIAAAAERLGFASLPTFIKDSIVTPVLQNDFFCEQNATVPVSSNVTRLQPVQPSSETTIAFLVDDALSNFTFLSTHASTYALEADVKWDYVTPSSNIQATTSAADSASVDLILTPLFPWDLGPYFASSHLVAPFLTVGVAVMIHLDDLQLTLSMDTLARIYNGNITHFNDTAIVATNPGLAIPGSAIVVVTRCDESDATRAFTSALAPNMQRASSLCGPSLNLGDREIPVSSDAHAKSAVEFYSNSIGYYLAYEEPQQRDAQNIKIIRHNEPVDLSAAGLASCQDSVVDLSSTAVVYNASKRSVGCWPFHVHVHLILPNDVAARFCTPEIRRSPSFVKWFYAKTTDDPVFSDDNMLPVHAPLPVPFAQALAVATDCVGTCDIANGFHWDEASRGCVPCSTGFVVGNDGLTCVPCGRGYYYHDHECAKCTSPGMRCDDEVTILRTVAIKHRYWRSGPTSAKVMKCYHRKACSGFRGEPTSSNAYCSHLTTGPLCDSCRHGAYLDRIGDRCRRCNNGRSFVVSVLVVVVFALAIVATLGYANGYTTSLLCDVVCSHQGGSPRRLCDVVCTHGGSPRIQNPFGTTTRKRHRETIQALGKVIFSTYQCIIFGETGLSVRFPPPFKQVLHALQVATFEIIVIPFTCLGYRSTFSSLLLIATIFPVALVAVVAVSYFVGSAILSPSEDERRSLRRQRHAQVALIIVFVALPSSSAVIFQTFNCESFDDGTSVISRYHETSCKTVSYQYLRAFAALMVVIYPFGGPLTFFGLVYAWRHRINPATSANTKGSKQRIQPASSSKHRCPLATALPPTSTAAVTEALRIRDADIGISPLHLLWADYIPSRYYFESVNSLFRIAVPGMLVFFESQKARCLWGTLASLGAGFLVAILRPYRDNEVGAIAHCAWYQIAFFFLTALFFIANVFEVSRATYGWVFFCGSTAVVASLFIHSRAIYAEESRIRKAAAAATSDLRSLIAAAGIPILVTDENLVVLEANESSATVFDHDDLLGRNLADDLLATNEADRVRNSIRRRPSGEKKRIGNHLGRVEARKISDGSKLFLLLDVIATEADEATTRITWLFQDVTALDKALDEVQIQNKVLNQFAHEIRNKNSAAGSMLDQIVHLMASSNSPEILKTELLKLESDMRLSMALIEEGNQLITTRLDLHKVYQGNYQSAPNVETVDLFEVMQHHVGMQALLRTNTLVKYTATIPKEYVGSKLWARVDMYMFSHLMNNLLSNARKHTFEGSVTLSFVQKENGLLEFQVADTGKGLTPSIQSRLFQEEVATGDVRGLGLGLVSCKLFATSIGGDIWVKSTKVADSGKNNGHSVFRFRLPGDLEVMPASLALTDSSSSSAEGILDVLPTTLDVFVIDDSKLLRTTIIRKLKRVAGLKKGREMNWTYHEHATVESFLPFIDEWKGTHDCLVTIDENLDSQGGVLRGRDLIKALRDVNFQGVLVSASGDEATVKVHTDLGVDLIWGKPLGDAQNLAKQIVSVRQARLLARNVH